MQSRGTAKTKALHIIATCQASLILDYLLK